MSSNRRMGAAAAVLLGAGLLLMIVPPLARDGVCGITSCADQVPVIAVSRLSATDLAVVVPVQRAADLDDLGHVPVGYRFAG